MSRLAALAAEQIDEFLEGAGAGTRLGEQLGTIGASIAIPALLVAIGVLAFVLYVHDGSGDEAALLTNVLVFCGLLIFVGAFVEVYGASLVVGEAWSEELLGGTFRGALLRGVAGVMCFVGFFRLGHTSKRYWIGILGIAVGVLSLAVTGHTVSEGFPALTVTMDIVHVTSGGIWVGGLVGLVLVFTMRRRATPNRMAPMVVRFSSIATAGVVAVAAAGIGMSFLIIDAPVDYVATPWGRILLIKASLVAAAAAIGTYNHLVVVPALERDPADGVYLRRSRATITIEAVLLIGVTFLSVLLTEAPTN